MPMGVIYQASWCATEECRVDLLLVDNQSLHFRSAIVLVDNQCGTSCSSLDLLLVDNQLLQFRSAIS